MTDNFNRSTKYNPPAKSAHKISIAGSQSPPGSRFNIGHPKNVELLPRNNN